MRLLEKEDANAPEEDEPPATPPSIRHHVPGLRAADRYLLTFAAFVVVVAGMKAASGILVPFLLAAFIAVICAPLFLAMQRRGVPAGIALLVMVLVLVGVGVVAAGVLERSLASLPQNLERYEAALAQEMTVLLDWLEAYGIALPDQTVQAYLDPELVIGYVGPIAGTLGEVLVTAFIILIVAVFILLEAAALPAKVRALPGLSTAGWERIREIVADVRRYMLLKTVMSILTGTLIGLMLAGLGVDFPILLGVLAFALNYIPNIGSFAAGLPGVLLALVEFGLGTAALTAIGYVVINVGVSNGIEPRYLGHGLGLSPLVVLVSVIFWGWVLGPIGMLLSVPLTMTLKIALENDDDTRWIAMLMGTRPRRRLRVRAAAERSGTSGDD